MSVTPIATPCPRNEDRFDRECSTARAASPGTGHAAPPPSGSVDAAIVLPAAGPGLLRLDANEGPISALDSTLLASLVRDHAVRRYPDVRSLEEGIAARLGLGADAGARVVVTAGGDEAIDRVCRVFAGPRREVVTATPTFEMIPRYARMSGAEVRSVPWSGELFPVEEFVRACSARTGVAAIVTPNNPTGRVATIRDVRRVSAALRSPRDGDAVGTAGPGVLLLDLAYTEFADEDLTPAALELGNVIVVRTFSKAFGLAGLRVGYAVASEEIAGRLRRAGGPYPVSAFSAASAAEALRSGSERVAAGVARVREERVRIVEMLEHAGAAAECARPQGNFVLARFATTGRARWVHRAMTSLGVRVRAFVPGSEAEHCLRITCPGCDVGMSRLEHSLRSASSPDAMLLDMDGVLADVSGSYRTAIVRTAALLGVRVSAEDVRAAKAAGKANNDWDLTYRLISAARVRTTPNEVRELFEALYHGSANSIGLKHSERLIPPSELLGRLGTRRPLAVVTGRPRRDCDEFLDRFGLENRFHAVVCMEDGPPKPSPDPVRRAMGLLGASTAWMIGDTVDDIASARAAGAVPIGIAPPGTDTEQAEARSILDRAGAAWVLNSLDELEELLP